MERTEATLEVKAKVTSLEMEAEAFPRRVEVKASGQVDVGGGQQMKRRQRFLPVARVLCTHGSRQPAAAGQIIEAQ